MPIRRKRSPWNKGLTVPESTKLKISLAQKRRWRNSPDLRATISARLKVAPKTVLNTLQPQASTISLEMGSRSRPQLHRDSWVTNMMALQGKVAWNKGKKMSLETREKMSLAKQGRHTPRSVRRKMSKSHQGLTHTPVRPSWTACTQPMLPCMQHETCAAWSCLTPASNCTRAC